MARGVSDVCGQLVASGLGGAALAESERRALSSGRRGGVVLFRRNTEGGPAQVSSLIAEARRAAPSDSPLLVAIDQEGGRVVRLGPPLMALPPMRALGDLDDAALVRRAAEAHGRELAALGITMSFAPVADVHTRAENPIIGDRAFATTPEKVARFAGAWADGLRDAGLSSCAKHFPGHGDTTVDSHLALPRVERDRAGLEAIEIAPFRALARSVPAMMSAHVVYPALDPEAPATLSRAICTDLLRGELGFEGVLFSDDLEMKAIALPVGEAAVRAVLAGCDAVLVCSRGDLADEAHAALVREAESSAAFRARCEQAEARVRALRRASGAPMSFDDAVRASAASRAELAARLEGRSP